MEILAKLGFDWHIALINFFNFLIIVFIVKKFILPKIQGILELREKKINDSLENAKKIERELVEAENVKKEIISTARKDANKLVRDGKSLASEIISGAKDEAINEKKNIIKKAQEIAIEQKEKIIKSSEEEISKLAVLATEKYLKS